ANTLLEGANVLRGMEFVPLHPRTHDRAGESRSAEEEREPVPLRDGAPVFEPDTISIVNEAAAQFWLEGLLPKRSRPIRRQWLTAMTLVACRFGTESLQWEECLRVTGTIVESARRRQRASTDTMIWIEQVLRSLGYEEAEAKALALQLTNLGVDEYRSGPVERMALARAPLEVRSE